VHDHTRDRVLRSHGITVVEHFDASECFEKPADVVRKFLCLLERRADDDRELHSFRGADEPASVSRGV
jgi:hypothetical protein